SAATASQLDDTRATLVEPSASNSMSLIEFNSSGTLADPRVRQALASAQRREDDARQVLLDATREVCATATAEASTAIDVWSARGGTVVSRGNSLVQLRGGQSARFSDRVTNSTKRCERGTASAGQRAALREATDARVAAEAAVRALEAEARRASLPLRYWR
ncbi:MAG: hypothetical protein ACO1OB_26395, partial [Archangium sp.]